MERDRLLTNSQKSQAKYYTTLKNSYEYHAKPNKPFYKNALTS
jgi:hypothetical protein